MIELQVQRNKKKSLNLLAIVVDSVMRFPLLRIVEGISLFLLFIDIIDLMFFKAVFMSLIFFLRGEVCLFRFLE